MSPPEDTSRTHSGPCRLLPGTVLLLLLLTAGYLALMFFFAAQTRYLALMVTVLVVSLFCFPRPSSWLMAIPLILLFGSGNIPIGDFYPAYLTIALFAYFAFYLLDKIIWNDPFPVITLPHRLILLALLIQGVSIAISIHYHGQYPLNALREGSGPFLFFPLAFIVPDICRDQERLQKLSRVCILGLLVAATFGVMQYFSISGFSRTDMSLGFIYKGRVASLLGNANVFAAYLEMTIPFIMALALWGGRTSGRWRIVSFLAISTGILSTLYTFSRGGLLAMVLGCGIVLVFWFRKQLWLPVLIFGIFIFVLIRSAETFERQMSFFLNPESQLTQPSLLHRYITYGGLWHQFSQAPLTGFGWGAREFYWGRTQIYTFWAIRHAVSSAPIASFGGLNNLLLSFAVKGGLVSLTALFLLTAAVVSAFVKGIGKAAFPWLIGISAGMLGLAVHQLMDNFLQWPQISSFFWLYFGILIAAGRTTPT
jgi:O-antigen ligase